MNLMIWYYVIKPRVRQKRAELFELIWLGRPSWDHFEVFFASRSVPFITMVQLGHKLFSYAPPPPLSCQESTLIATLISAQHERWQTKSRWISYQSHCTRALFLLLFFQLFVKILCSHAGLGPLSATDHKFLTHWLKSAPFYSLSHFT